ncbi:MAG: Imm52 family immunity protein [Cystobacter sp.]
MYEWYYIGSYWGPRKETPLECARRAELFLHMLSRCDPTFTQWYRGGRGAPRELPGHPVHPDAAEWEQLFSHGRLRADVGKQIIEEFGFAEQVWNSKGADRTRIELRLGAYSQRAVNTCLLRPPQEGPNRERILCAPLLTDILVSMATAWDPDFAVVSSSEMVELIEKRRGDVPVGWLTYLSHRLGTVPPLPSPVRIEPVGSLGSLLILSQERMTASNPEHVAFIARIRDWLERAGLIRRPAVVADAD